MESDGKTDGRRKEGKSGGVMFIFGTEVVRSLRDLFVVRRGTFWWTQHPLGAIKRTGQL